MDKTLTHFATVCPSCLAELKVKYSYVGSQVQCNYCGHGFHVLAPEVQAAPKSRGEDGAGVDRMMILCPSCSTTLKIRRAYAGSLVECKKCKHQFLVQENEELPPFSPPQPAGQSLIEDFDGTPDPAGDDPQKPVATNGHTNADESQGMSFARECERLRNWFEDLEQDRALVVSERNVLSGQLEAVRRQYDLLLAEAEHSKEETNRLETELARLRNCPPEPSPEEVEALKAESATLKDQIETLKAESATLKDQIETLKDQVEILKAESATLKAQVETVNDENLPLKTESVALKAQVETLKAHLETLNAEIATLDAEIETLEIDGHTLQTERDSLHAQHESSIAERETLRTELEATRSQVFSLQCERETRRTELETTRGQVLCLQSERDALLSELEAMRTQAQSLQHERQALKTELKTTRGKAQTLRVERETLQSERDALRAELETTRGLTRSLQDQQDALRTELDTISSQVLSLHGERETLRDELESTRGQVLSLQNELSARPDLSPILAQRDAELAAARSLAEQQQRQSQELRDQVEQLEPALHDIQQERSRLQEQISDLDGQIRDLHSQLRTANAERVALQEQNSRLEECARESRAACDELVQQIRQRDETLRARQAELESLSELHQSTQRVVEQLQDTFAQREKELIERANYAQDQTDELKRKLEVQARDFHIMQTAFDELNLQFDDLKAAHERMKTTYTQAQTAHEETTARLTGNLQFISDRLQAAETDLAALRARESSLLKQCENLKVERSLSFGLQKSRLEVDLEEFLLGDEAQSSNQVAAIHIQLRENWKEIERLKGEIVTFAASQLFPDADLQAAREEIAHLREKLADSETMKRSMSSVLEGLGVRLH